MEDKGGRWQHLPRRERRWSRGATVRKTSITSDSGRPDVGDEFKEHQSRSAHLMGCLVEYRE
jgi:hypothetical protein